MSDFDVVDDGMTNRALSDADIEALIAGTPVAGAPAPLTDLLVSLRQRAAGAPRVPVSGALSEFIVGTASPLTPTATSDRRSRVVARRPTSLLARASALLGLVPAYVLIGATAAAAAVGGAQLLGIVDVSFLPDRGHHVETPAPSEPEPGAAVPPVATTPTTAPTSSTIETGGHSTSTPAVPEPPTSQRPAPAVPVLPDPADTNATTVGCGPATTQPAGPPTSHVATQTSPPANACEPSTPVSTTPVTPTPGTRPPVPAAPPNSSQPTAPPAPANGSQPAQSAEPNPEGRPPNAAPPTTIGQSPRPSTDAQEASPTTSARNLGAGSTP